MMICIIARPCSVNFLNGAKRLNDWNVWNGLIPRDERSTAIERLERLELALSFYESDLFTSKKPALSL